MLNNIARSLIERGEREGGGRKAGGKKGDCMAFRGGAKTRIKKSKSEGKWEVGPLYRVVAVWSGGGGRKREWEAGPGDGRQKQ